MNRFEEVRKEISHIRYIMGKGGYKNIRFRRKRASNTFYHYLVFYTDRNGISWYRDILPDSNGVLNLSGVPSKFTSIKSVVYES